MRVIISIILCFYLTATFGISSVEHYCGDDYAGTTFWGLVGNNKCACSPKKMKKAKNCCKEKRFFAKISLEQNTSFYSIPPFSPLLIAEIPQECKLEFPTCSHSVENILPRSNAPPNAHKPSIYLVFRKILI